MHPAVTSIAETKEKWLGTVEVADSGYYVDHYLLLIFGGIPWQVSTLYTIRLYIKGLENTWRLGGIPSLKLVHHNI